MEVTLSADLKRQVEQELASGRYQSPDELIEKAVRQFPRSVSVANGDLVRSVESAKPLIRPACMSEC